jgi:hypothetical protein
MWTRKTEFTIKFTADLDGVPGWGHQPEDWIALATREFDRQTHYHTKAEVLSVEVIPPRDEVSSGCGCAICDAVMPPDERGYHLLPNGKRVKCSVAAMGVCHGDL